MRETLETKLLADFILIAFDINNHGAGLSQLWQYLFLSPDMAGKHSVHPRLTASWSACLILIQLKVIFQVFLILYFSSIFFNPVYR